MPQFHLLIKSGLSEKSLHWARFHFLQHPIRLTTITVNEGPTKKSDFTTLSSFVLGHTWVMGDGEDITVQCDKTGDAVSRGVGWMCGRAAWPEAGNRSVGERMWY